ncbi:tRNA (adenosine(37)-N6)-dimethylallyltransferase MiaA [Chiayiivirga flava]|uniref:tRNA dimethylallyltransferase n=1 Tax=Chiayiivirga flava TaxID=659595 RepID=A0A7W8D6W8_9GAMM|nr:tRNA (adenosine(37)-N6)-dimethylallyltransferase MiaA [Chiayiivirga flava]MBB5209020.1 tRNA dimethylallyltransferase [Chiayiivirga flava]
MIATPRTDARPPLIALMGPTASGKTALAADWAQRRGARIVSVDSALVYRGLQIGSAKPDAALLARAPHRLIDIRDPHEIYSAADFRADALREIAAIVADGGLPLLVGGTGLYFRALLQGLAPMPDADPALRAELEADAAIRGWPALHAMLAAIDAEAAARIGANDAQRIQRALEVWRRTGRTISDWQRSAMPTPLPYRVLKLVLAPRDRAVLHARIALRFDQMLRDGLVEEVRALRTDPRLHADLPSMRAVGYRQTWEFLDGAGTRADLRERGIAATRQLAKRQLTWLRGELDARWLDPDTDRVELERAADGFLARP